MPLFRCEIHKLANGKKFANDYEFEATTLGDAAALAADWASLEQSLMGTFVQFLDIRTSTATVGDRSFIHTPLNFAGTSDFTTDICLPAFCCLRLDFQTASSDSGHKYYRYVVQEPFNVMGTLTPVGLAGYRSTVASHLTSNPDMLTALRVGKLGASAVAVTVYSFVQERQERRRRKKKAVVAGGAGV